MHLMKKKQETPIFSGLKTHQASRRHYLCFARVDLQMLNYTKILPKNYADGDKGPVTNIQ